MTTAIEGDTMTDDKTVEAVTRAVRAQFEWENPAVTATDSRYQVEKWKRIARAAIEAHEAAKGDEVRQALAAELEYRVRTAAALAKGGHDINAEVDKGKASIRRILHEHRRQPMTAEGREYEEA